MGKIMKKNSGFSLVELMVSMAISSMVIGAIYGVYTIQSRSYTVQEQVSEMQQKGRATLDFMARDIRMVGYDAPNGSCFSGGISTANSEEFKFETCDAGTKKTVRYFFADAHKSSGMHNGIEDDLFRDSGTAQLIVEGLDALEFRYFDKEGIELSLPVNTKDIRSIQISLLIRSSYPDQKYRDTIEHKPASGSDWKIQGLASNNPPNDNFHRRLLITTVKLRNMGL